MAANLLVKKKLLKPEVNAISTPTQNPDFLLCPSTVIKGEDQFMFGFGLYARTGNFRCGWQFNYDLYVIITRIYKDLPGRVRY